MNDPSTFLEFLGGKFGRTILTEGLIAVGKLWLPSSCVGMLRIKCERLMKSMRVYCQFSSLEYTETLTSTKGHRTTRSGRSETAWKRDIAWLIVPLTHGHNLKHCRMVEALQDVATCWRLADCNSSCRSCRPSYLERGFATHVPPAHVFGIYAAIASQSVFARLRKSFLENKSSRREVQRKTHNHRLMSQFYSRLAFRRTPQRNGVCLSVEWVSRT